MLIDDLKVEDMKRVDANASQNDNAAGEGADKGAAAADNSNSAAADGGADKGEADASAAAAGADGKAQPDAGSGNQDADDDVVAFKTLTEETGVEVRTNQDLTDRLKELADFKSGKAELPGLSPALKKAMEIERSGGNITDFFRAFTLNEAQMSDKDVLRHLHLQTDKLAQKNPNLAGMTFDRQYNAEFSEFFKWQSITDELDKQAYYKEHAENIEYQKELHAHKVTEGREAIKAQKDNYPVTVSAQGPSKEEQDLLIEKHNKAVEATLTGFKVVDIPIDEKEKFNIGLNSETKPIVEKWMRDMKSFLADLGIKPDGFDYDKLMKNMVLVAEIKNKGFGARFKKQILDNKDVNTLENDLNGNRNIDRSENGGNNNLSAEQEIAKQAKERREQNKR